MFDLYSADINQIVKKVTTPQSESIVWVSLIYGGV